MHLVDESQRYCNLLNEENEATVVAIGAVDFVVVAIDRSYIIHDLDSQVVEMGEGMDWFHDSREGKIEVGCRVVLQNDVAVAVEVGGVGHR